MKASKVKSIAIANPSETGSRYTSVKKALEYVRRGRAVMENGMLRFVAEIPYRRKRVKEDESMTWWNGDDRTEGAMRRPGEVVS